jgi:manganese oxidase
VKHLLSLSIIILVLSSCTTIAYDPGAENATRQDIRLFEGTPTPTPASMTGSGMGHEMEGSHGAGHMMEPIGGKNVQPAPDTNGGLPLSFQLEDGVKVFDITTQAVYWPILEDVTVTAWTYNGTVPGPMIRVTEGDRVRINLKNELDVSTTVHWHGIDVPNAMDGVPGLTQEPILPGEIFTYEFVAKPAGTFMYHSHFEGDIQVMAGLYAPFIIDPIESVTEADVDVTLMISEMLFMGGETYAAMPMAGMEPNFFTINGKAFPATETIEAKVGQRVRIRMAAIGQFVHPMHLHGTAFKIVATDGHPVPETAQLTKDTVTIGPGERYDIEFIATEPGQWMLHCHILHHTTNDGIEPGGLMLIVNITE